MWILIYLTIFIISFLLSFFLTFLFKKISIWCNILDLPSSRKIHQKPTPLLGGLGIFFSFLLTILLGFISLKTNFIFQIIKEHLPGIISCERKLLSIVIGGVLVVSFGIFDDIFSFRARIKLIFQILISIIVFSSGIRISLFVPNIFFSILVTVFWIVLMMNSFNLLDNMDGLSAGVSFICGGILFISAFYMNQLFVSTLIVVFLGSVAGFLKHNFPPAKVFMGECGSSFLGYFLGIISILLTFYRYGEGKSFLPVFTPLIVFSVPFFDTISVFWIRKKRKLSIFQADKNHLSHRLVNLGMSNKQAVLLIYFLTICTGMGTLFLNSLNIFGGILVIVQVVIILSIVGILELSGRKKNDTNNSGT